MKLEEISQSLEALSIKYMGAHGFFKDAVNSTIIDEAIDCVGNVYSIIDGVESGELIDVELEAIKEYLKTDQQEANAAQVFEKCLQSFAEGKSRDKATGYISSLEALFQESLATALI